MSPNQYGETPDVLPAAFHYQFTLLTNTHKHKGLVNNELASLQEV